MTKEKAIELVLETDKNLVMLTHIISSLNWDLETQAPKAAVLSRSEQCGYLSDIAYKKIVDKNLEEALETLKDEKIEDVVLNKIVNNLITKNKKQKVLPKSFAKEFATLTSTASSVWAEAKKKNDFSLYSPTLEKIISMCQMQSLLWSNNSNKYDALLNEYENSITCKDIDKVFNPLKDYIISFLNRRCDKKIDNSFLFEKYDIEKQKEFGLKVIKDMGFDFNKGLECESIHPFTSTLGYDDVRITTSFDEKDLLSPLFSTIHEAGHALYEQNCTSKNIYKTTLAEGCSLGFHESQSRLYENIIGRSKEFWSYYYPKLVDAFPRQLKKVDLETFLLAINKVEQGKIRVNADEVTYNLHVMLRYEIEKEIIENQLKVDQIPSSWNSLTKEYLNIDVKNDSEGVLQDIHWSGGSFGYFPTYTLGNLYSAMIMQNILEENKDMLNQISKGNLLSLKDVLKDKVWQYGSLYSPKELLNKICSKEISEKPFVNYLETKYTDLNIIK